MTSLAHDRTIDPAMIARVAREVIRRLRETGTTKSTSPGEKLITIETLNRYPDGSQITVLNGRSVITPAAREEALRRGIKIVCGKTGVSTSQEADHSEASDVLSLQLQRRGISLPLGTEVVWSDRPAEEVCRRCSGGQRATMIATLSDVDRFAKEFAPTTWVLDQQKLNLVAAVNVAARIARIAQPTNGGKG